MTLVLRQGAWPAVGGMVIGLSAAAALCRLLAGMLFGLSPLDPMTFAGISLLLATVALAASCVPARRATKVDPLLTIRSE
jgi:putative ABC transport system permease protein